MLWWFQRLMLGPITSKKNSHLPDLTRNEWAVLVPLVVVIFWFGLNSEFWTHRMESSVNLLVGSNESLNDDYPTASRSVKENSEFLHGILADGHIRFTTWPTVMVEHPTIEPVLYKNIPVPKKDIIRGVKMSTSPNSMGAPGGAAPSGARPRPRPNTDSSARRKMIRTPELEAAR